MTNAEMDRLVLEALRSIASGGARARIRGKAVQEATPYRGQCVYVRVGGELAKKGIEVPNLLSPDLVTQYRLLLDSMKRLSDNDLLFNHGGHAIEDRTFWVVME
jgi:hypothetical protein